MSQVVQGRWIVPPNQALPQLIEQYTKTIMLAGRRVAHQRAEDATAWMKERAPWQDRTGDARKGLHVEEKESPGVLTELVFTYSEETYYSVYLETRFAGRDSILAPAIDYWGPKLMQDVQRIVNLGLAAR